jgi:Uma2 family endonuclease
VELRSSSDSLKGLQDKMQEYIDNGALLGLLIDRQHPTVHLYRANQEPEIFSHPEFVTGDPELPGFVLKWAKVW